MTAPLPAKPLPVYIQIAELLMRQIRAGHWQLGERLPTEAELAASLQVAVGTLRKSLALMAEQGYLDRVQGSGTYVRAPQPGGSIYEFFRLELHDGPGLPTARIISVLKVPRPDAVPVLGETAHGQVWRVRRLRQLNQVPVALEEIFFDARLTPTLKMSDLGDAMYRFYQERFGLWIARAEDHVSVRAAPAWAPEVLGLQPGCAAGYIERRSRLASGVCAEYSHTWFDPAVCRYAVRMGQ